MMPHDAELLADRAISRALAAAHADVPACAECERLRTRLEAAEADTKRLDWWEQNLHVHHSRCSADGKIRVQLFIGALPTCIATADTLRQAIDAALAQGGR